MHMEMCSVNPETANPTPKACPQCGSSQRLYKDGLRYLADGSSLQRWLCRNCGFRFSQSTAKSQQKINVAAKLRTLQPGSDLAEAAIRSRNLAIKKTAYDSAFSLSEDVGAHSVTIVGKALNTLRSYTSNRRVCVPTRGAKNLVISETRQEKPMREGTMETADVKGKLVEYLWYLKKQGRCEATAKGYISTLKTLINYGVDILNPETVKLFLAYINWSGGTKKHAVEAYNGFLKMLKIEWEPPKYKHVGKLPFIPTEEEIDLLISAVGTRTATLLQLLKETGMRIGEALKISWIDVDVQRKVVTITPEKGSQPRILAMSDKLIGMLQRLRKKSELVFPARRKEIAINFYRQRRNVSEKLANPRIHKISFHTFRHWKGTMEYHKTKDILHVQQVLGHRDITSTMIYINIEAALFQNLSQDFYVKTAKTIEEAGKLIETGFEFVHEFNNVMIFRKRK